VAGEGRQSDVGAIWTPGEAESLVRGAVLDAGAGQTRGKVDGPQVDRPEERLELVVGVAVVVAGSLSVEFVGAPGEAGGQVGFPGEFSGVAEEPVAAAADGGFDFGDAADCPLDVS
jgi:hypothetical protein